MTQIDMHYVIRRMIKALWIAVLAGIIAAGGIWAKTKLDSGNHVSETTTWTAEGKAGISDDLAEQDLQGFNLLTSRIEENENNSQGIGTDSGEDNANIENQKIDRMENGAMTAQSVLLKKILLFFALGFLLVEGIVFLIAIFNDTVKSPRDLTQNTDLEVLDDSRAGREHDWTALLVKIKANATNEDQLVVLRDAAVSGREWINQTKQMMAENGGGESLLEITGLELSAEQLEMLTNRKVLLAVKQEKTNYKTLRKLSDDLNQIHADVIGAVVEA